MLKNLLILVKSIRLYLILAGLGVALISGAWFHGYYHGKAAAEAKQASEQLKEDNKNRKHNAKIDKNTPSITGSKSAAWEWMRHYGHP